MKKINIGIKYCGGCNPRFDRKSVVHSLNHSIDSDFQFTQTDSLDSADIILLIGGCPNCCIDTSQLNENVKLLSISENPGSEFLRFQIINLLNGNLLRE